VGGLLESVNTRDAEAVIGVFLAAAHANLNARCRPPGTSQDVIGPDHPTQRLIATGDLHDNPEGLGRLVELAGMTERGATPTAHLTLHEVIHSDRLVNGMDFSYRTLVRVAALKAQFPEHVHTLLANHELSQIAGAGIVKDGVSVVEAFNAGVEYVFGSAYDEVTAAMASFIRSMPLALRWRATVDPPNELPHAGRGRDLVCTHSLPDPMLMDRFDPGVLDRPTIDADYTPRRGSAHILVWGRGHQPEHLQQLATQFDAGLFVLGHEKAPEGVLVRPPNAVVLNTDSAHAMVLELTRADVRTIGSLAAAARRLSH
jgi:hypothetical protein